MKANAIELAYVEETLRGFEELGLRRNTTFDLPMQAYADAVVEGYPDDEDPENPSNRIVRYAPCPRLSVLWVTECETTGKALAYFSNSLVFVDHCFDVVDFDGYERYLREIVSIASSEWQPRIVRTRGKRSLLVRTEDQLAVETNGEQHELLLTGAKDFDRNILAQLNKMIPDIINARFAYFGDGGLFMVMWLPVTKLASLGCYCGVTFVVP